MKSLNLFFLITLFFITSFAIADNHPESSITESSEPVSTGPADAIRSALINLNQLSKSLYTPQKTREVVENQVVPLFDFDKLAKEVLLFTRVSLSNEELKYFTSRLQNSILTGMLTKFAQIRTTSFKFMSARPSRAGSIIVQLGVFGYASYPMYIDLVFHQNDEQKWLIYDVVLNRDSLINYYRKMAIVLLNRYGKYGMLGRI
ncbi:ABC transporter substrate-binding protein [Gammaproteobacteria bacterium]|nr:ABC transporter substrate-binding protein [Gammaproteobacteria bacterium]